jgi:hypothetical protein
MVGLLGNEKTQRRKKEMRKPLFPTDGYGWAWLNQNPVNLGPTDGQVFGGVIVLVLAVCVGFGAIAYDQMRDARWDAERAHLCDTRGC